MSNTHTYVVRVVVSRNRELTGDALPDAYFNFDLLGSLHDAELVTIHRNDNSGICFDLLPPLYADSHVWAAENAKQWKAFGYNAVKAPKVVG